MLATVEKIQEINNHPNADKLELATCCNYQCIVPIGKYKVGNPVVFIHPDSTLPKDREWAQSFLPFCKSRVKAVRFRGEWSFGIVAGLIGEFKEFRNQFLCEGDDVAELLGVKKYEVKYPQHQKNKLNPRRPHLPYNLPKTDETRWQGIRDFRKLLGERVDITLKIDGQSFTAYYRDEDFGVTSRGTDYKLDVEDRNNFTCHLDRYPIQENLTKFCIDNKVNLAIRGESYGPGIQNFKHNPYSKKDYGLALFSVFNLDKLRYERRQHPYYLWKIVDQLGVPTVPIIEENVKLTMDLIHHYEEVEDIDGEKFEGVVINGNQFSFKVINFKYDEKK
jgi:RNA ligase (TIGR02306 family)